MTESQTPPRAGTLDEIRRAVTTVAVPYHEPPAVVLRRRVVSGIVLVSGAVLFGLAMAREPGKPTLDRLALGLAAVWVAGALVSGPLHLGGICWRGRNQRPVITGTTVGLLLGAIFVLGGLVVRRFPALADPVQRVLIFADQGSWRLVVLIALVSAVAEEMFFRGALYTALERHYPVVTSTVLYTAVACASGNAMLGFAAAVLGLVCGIERRATGGILAPVLTHLVWGLVIVLALPPMFGV